MKPANVNIPEDRTIKQPSMAFCRNPACRERSDQEFQFVVEHAEVACPKCGANRTPMIGMLTLTHWLYPSPTGPIRGYGGLPYQIACDTRRAYLATATNNEAATDNPKIVNCPGCLAVIEKLKPKTAVGQEMVLEK